MKPTHVYVFGPLSGPYKIGYTCDLQARGYTLRMMKMAQHAITHSAKQHSIFWYHETLPDQASAHSVEQAAHRSLKGRRLAHPRSLRHPYQEWFDVDLVDAIEAVKSAACFLRVRLAAQSFVKTD